MTVLAPKMTVTSPLSFKIIIPHQLQIHTWTQLCFSLLVEITLLQRGRTEAFADPGLRREVETPPISLPFSTAQASREQHKWGSLRSPTSF